MLRLQAGGQGRQRRLQVSTGGLEGAPARSACSGVLDLSRLKPVLLVWGALRAVAACCSKRHLSRVSVCPTPNPVRPLSTPLAGASMPPAAATTTRSVWGRNRASHLYGEQGGSRVGTGLVVHAACWSFPPFPVCHARLPVTQTALPGSPSACCSLAARKRPIRYAPCSRAASRFIDRPPSTRRSPLHTCKTCGGYAEGGPGKDGELVPCRRCPVAYHRRCLPADLPLCRDRQETPLPRVWLADYDEEAECELPGAAHDGSAAGRAQHARRWLAGVKEHARLS